MRHRATVFICTLFLSPMISLLAATTQDGGAEASPLTVSTRFFFELDSRCKEGQGLTVTLRYKGAKPLRGYVVGLALTDTLSGKVVQEQVVEEVRDLRQGMIASGAEWTRSVCTIPAKALEQDVTLAAKVDVLKFADGSIWGPAALRESHLLIGTIDGMDFIAKKTELQKFVSPISPEQGPVPGGDIRSEKIGPLKIDSGVWSDERGQEKVAVEITNASDKAIRGFLFTTSFFDPATGKRIRRVSTKELETHCNASEYLAPGATWVADPRKFSYLEDGKRADYKITVDMVVFADGSIAGPMESQESAEVLGMVRGIDMARGTSVEEVSAKRER
jgi:hypothetical protein